MVESGSPTTMTYFEDTGDSIPLPFQRVIQFLDSAEHGGAHAGDVRNFKVVKTVGLTTTLSFERLRDGKWTPAVSRLTVFPPFCYCVEELKGTFAGSRFVGIHRPAGKRTRVDLFGDVRSKVYPPAKAKRLLLRTLAKAHREDLAAIRAWRKRHS